MATISPSLRWTLYTLGFLGFYGTWIRSGLNGTLSILFRSLHVTGTLLGSELPLKTRITGIYWPLDYLLDMLIAFFWQAVDGSHPSTSLFALYFAAQHIAVIVSMYVDSYKSNRVQSWKLSPTLWLYVFQATAVATSGPWFMLFTLAATEASTSFNTSKANAGSISFIPLTVLFGYILLVFGMAIPSTGTRAIVSSGTQQVAVAIWNVFPIFTGLLQWTFQTLFSSSAVSNATSQQSSRNNEALLSALRRTYAFAIFCSFAAHAAVLAITFSTIMFPTMFSQSAIQLLHPRIIFTLPLSHAEVFSMGAGALQFLQWDLFIGFTTVLIPAVVKYRRMQASAGNEENLAGFSLKALAAVLLFGPGAAFLRFKWLDDEAALGEEAKKKRSS
ncbi:hypothetical protein BKA65DRAFT_539587 [Rhexocercosporidium sp. MPI-PUGE-AT-0058]|nr:hypothetical protein BKA65DRAFT_539587 [Rhexocercosporidium sp. MPI-PUGE-AT-0058]